jgi:succinate dehydrogenase/fumarate reductase flavoprotein subunit
LRTASCVQIFRETADIAHDTDKFGGISVPRRYFAGKRGERAPWLQLGFSAQSGSDEIFRAARHDQLLRGRTERREGK